MSDTPKTNSNTDAHDTRVENYAEIDRRHAAPGSHRASKELLRRPRAKGRKSRLEAFSEIDHGKEV